MNSDECAGHWKARRDEAMRERNKVIALLARLFPAGLSQQTDAGGRTRPCVIIDLPTGQVSWHYATEDAWPFEGLPAYLGEYDGHT